MKRVCGGMGVSPVQPARGAADRQVKGKIKVKINGDGQECPSHTSPVKG